MKTRFACGTQRRNTIKIKKKVADAWARIADSMNMPVDQLKKKKEGLMATFRNQLRKKQESMRSGAGVEDIYEPIWFAYEAMEKFLLPLYKCRSTINTENSVSKIKANSSFFLQYISFIKIYIYSTKYMKVY